MDDFSDVPAGLGAFARPVPFPVNDVVVWFDWENTQVNPSYTLHPLPYTLHPPPSTLHHPPSTLFPELETLNPKPSSLNPEP